MAEADPQDDGNRRLTLSESRVRDIVENAVLKLQVTLGQTYASVSDVTRVQDLAKGVADEADRKIATLEGIVGEQRQQIVSLQEDKAGRDAVTSFKKWLTGGAILGTLLMAAVVVLTFYQITHPQVVHKP